MSAASILGLFESGAEPSRHDGGNVRMSEKSLSFFHLFEDLSREFF
jgi:hypothetical protein